MPALTIVAECRKAEAGVGALIASGSQIWKGIWALFVKAPRAINPKIIGYQALCRRLPPLVSKLTKSALPAVDQIKSTPASKAIPPPAVIRSALKAPRRAVSSLYL